MDDPIYKRLKKQNGEKFAQALRNFHNGILEVPELDVIVRHAGREAEPLLPYLMSLLAIEDDGAPEQEPGDPFALLAQAGYDAFHADTLGKQNSIRPYFRKGELLCTFNDASRYEDYHVVHAVKKNAEAIQREAFNGKEKRQDEYGTSVISIQIAKKGGFISIKNRYNHTVPGCDNTFGSNPDNIIPGLSAALKKHFNVDFSAAGSLLPEGFILAGKQVFKYHQEINNIYYGDQTWARDGEVNMVDKSAGDALFGQFLFDNKTKTLKKINPESADSFADDFNGCYGGNRALSVRDGNLVLNGEILIGADQSRIKTVNLPALTTMGHSCLSHTYALTELNAPALTTMGEGCLLNAHALTELNAPALITMEDHCLDEAPALTKLNTPVLTAMGDFCLREASALTEFNAPALTTMGKLCLNEASALMEFNAPTLTTMGGLCLGNAPALTEFNAPALTTMGKLCLREAPALTEFNAPALTTMGDFCLLNAHALRELNAPALTTMGDGCLRNAPAAVLAKAQALVRDAKKDPGAQKISHRLFEFLGRHFKM